MASKIIKGLTVEIGGDTTKLGKALEEVNKKSVDLSGELRDVNKLLKLDPGNTDALAQKQKILADSIDNTKKKLNTLKEAEKQVQQQFKRGEVSEEQVRALQREIIATTAKLKKEEQEAEKTSKQLKGFADSSDKAGEAGESMGSKLGKAAVGGLKAVAAAVGAALGAMVGAAEGSREYRTEMGKLDTAFTTSGHSSAAATETYKTLQGVLGETDQAVEAANHLAKLAENEEDLATWTNIATGVYATFGASLPVENITEAANETAKTGKIVGGLADALNWAGVSEEEFQAQLDACTTEQERQALITTTLNGLYSEAADKYRETNAEVIRANEANEAWASSMAEVGAAVDPILTDVKLLGASLLSDFLPGITSVTTAFRGLLNGDDGAADALGEALSGIVTQLLQKVTELAPTIVQTGVSLITTLTTTLITMLPQLVTTGVSLISTILTGVTSAIPILTQALVDMIPQLAQALVTGIPQLLQGAVSLFLAILDAIPQILPPLVAALPSIVIAVVDSLLTAIPQLIQGALTFLLAIVQAVPMLLDALLPEIPTIVTTVVEGLLDNLPLLVDAAYTLFFALVEAVPKIALQLLQALPQIWQAIWSVLKSLPSRMWNLLLQVISKFTTWGSELRGKASQAAHNVLSTVVNGLKSLPSKVWTAIKGAISKVTQWGRDLAAKGKQAATDLWNAIVNKIKGIPDKMKSIGSDLVEGLWNGIKDMAGWVKDKIGGFADDVLDKIKGFFGVHSPSTKTAWMGEMLAQGLAKGITDNADQPLDAMNALSDDMLDQETALNGLTLQRKLNTTFSAPQAAATEKLGLMDKLDRILEAIERGQIITLDSDALVGSTLNKYDDRLGQRRALAARGAL